ncbi:MAG: hypothetical protein LEGION0398_MBIBDBAK_01354 [Legionellaceae bacterium]
MSFNTALEEFQNYLLGNDSSIEQAIVSPNKKYANSRLKIYYEAYRLRLTDLLKIDFPCIYQWLGNKNFEKLALYYISKFPSTFFSAREFGKYMPTYLSQTEPYNNNSFLTEFAQFERILSETIDAPNAPIVTINDLAQIAANDWPLLRFSLHPTTTLLLLNWNTPLIRNTLLLEEKKIKAKLLETPTFWLIWRHNNIDIKYIALNEQESFIINAFIEHKTFDEICQGLTQWMSEEAAALYMVQFLQKWLNEQIISTITINK